MTLSFNKLNEIAAIYESIADSEKEQLDEQGNESNMAIWAKANPKLAAAKAERDRTRGTSATTNPLMKDMKSGLPAPKPSPTAAKVSPTAAKVSPTAAKVSPTAAPAKPTPPTEKPPTAKPPTAKPPTAKPPMTAFQAAGGNAKLAQLNKGKSPRAGRATASTIERQGQDNLYKAGGGDAAIAKGPTTTRNVRGGGTQKVPTLTRQDIINKGTVAANLKQSFEYDAYDLVLEYLLSQGHAETVAEAQYLMTEMDAEMIGDIVEARMDPRGRPASGPMNVYAKSKGKPDQAHLDAVKAYDEKQKKKTPEQRKKELDDYKERQRNR
jgi:hypothetical protein